MNTHLQKYLKSKCPANVFKFKTNFTNCILDAFIQHGYQQTEEEDWDIIWSEKQRINQLYERRLNPTQRINHFKNYFQLCKKDLLVRNLKKHKKALQRQGKTAQAAGYDFFPMTYILPIEYVLFADEFKRQANTVWIMKPTGKSQGKGIFLFNRLQQIAPWQHSTTQPYIAQKYIAQPLLIGGKKFDLRLYVLTLSYNPLTVYFYRGGFARFTHCRYEETKIQQSEIHLTNVAVQKNAQGYDENIGGKWYLNTLKTYLLSLFGQEDINNCFLKIEAVVMKTLDAMSKVMGADRPQSFELYGFDVLLDAKLTPWLIQVNGSPSMTANTPKDKIFKMDLLADTLTVLDLEKHMLGTEDQIGAFDLLCRAGNIKKKKYSFLGTANNRNDNLKKLAKAYAPRLNQLYEKVEKQKKNTIQTIKGKEKMKKQALKQTKAVNTPSIAQSNVTIKALSNNNIPPTKRGFVIKKVKRESTNEN